MRSQGRRGSSVIELALSLSVIGLVFAGSFQFGYAFHVYNALTAAVREGARHASMRTYEANTETPSPAYVEAIRNTVLFGTAQPRREAKPFAPGLRAENVRVEPIFRSGRPVEVRVSIENYELNALFKKFQLAGKPSATFPYLGVYAPQ
jgi:Flp pilus assembly protein TadG